MTKAEQVKLINDIPAVGEFIIFNDEFGFVIGRVIKLHESHVRVVRLYMNELDEWFERGDAYQVDVSRTKIVKLVKLYKRKVKEDVRRSKSVKTWPIYVSSRFRGRRKYCPG